jgi:dihydrofolate reductase
MVRESSSNEERNGGGTKGRKIHATFFMALDGVVEDPGWSLPFWDEGTHQFKEAELKVTDDLLLGRNTYEEFARAWPPRRDFDAFSRKFNTMPKHVVTRTLKSAEWENSHILEGDPKTAIEKLKSTSGGDIGVHGSISLTQWLMKIGLLDELHILLYPITVGKGRRLFEDTPAAHFKLVQSEAFKTGVISMVYERTEAPQATGTVQQEYARALKRTRHLDTGIK